MGDSGRVYRYDGASWADMDPGPYVNLDIRGIWGSSPSNIILTGYHDVYDDNRIVHYDGLYWYQVNPPGPSALGVWGSSASDVFVVGDGYSILHFGGPTCTFDINPRSAVFPKTGGVRTGAFDVTTTPQNCVWNAVNHFTYATLDNACGIGDGTVNYTVKENNRTYIQSGYIALMNQFHRVTLLNNNCEYTIDPGSSDFGSLGGSGAFTVTPSVNGCSWVFESEVPWITVTAPADGYGTTEMAVEYSVDANQSWDARTGAITMMWANNQKGLTHDINQAGNPVPVLSVSGSAGAEPNIPGTFVIASPVAPAGNRTIGYTVGGSATSGTDFTALPGSVVLASGNYSVTVTLNVKDDDELEGNETVMLTLQPGSGYSLGPITSSTIAIFDNDTYPYDIYLPTVLR